VTVNDQITEALQRLDANVAEAETRFAEAEANYKAALNRLNEARLERRGADKLAHLLRAAPGGDAAPASDTRRGSSTGLTHAVEQAMRSSAGAVMTTNDVMALPEVREVAPDRQQVRNALHYLNRKHIIEAVGRGKWRLPASNDFDPAQEAGPREASENGLANHADVLIGAYGSPQPVG
jgi:hypothetical protein